MTINIIIKPSSEPDKKYDAVTDDKKTISFGAKNYSDYTIPKDDERKQRYIARHKKNEQWDNINTAWEKPTLKEAVKNINNKFKHINVKLK